jgi:hypothetical protein
MSELCCISVNCIGWRRIEVRKIEIMVFGFSGNFRHKPDNGDISRESHNNTCTND